ncbi:MAG: CHAD domain-containing protein [Planctomycetota bacterium]
MTQGPENKGRGDPVVKRSDSIAVAAGKALRFHFEQMLANDEGVRVGEEIEAVHDMRVATRRLRAALRAFRKPIGGELLEPHRVEMKWLGSALGQARDMDVWLEYLRAYLQDAPPDHREDIQTYLDAETTAREARRRDLIAALDSERFVRLREGFQKLLDTDLAACGAGKRIGPFAARSIRKRMKKVLAYDDVVESAPESELHRLRIAGKRLRYTCEFFADCFGKRVAKMIEMLRAMQDALGALHDTVVWRDRIGETKSEALVRLKQRLTDEADRHRDEFLRIWSKLTSRKFQKALRKELRRAAK